MSPAEGVVTTARDGPDNGALKPLSPYSLSEAIMFGKSGFILRALFATVIVGSLVACTFEAPTDEDRGLTTSNIDKDGNGKDKKKAAQDDDSDACACNEVDSDAGPYDHDGGPYDNDGGGWGGHDGGWGGNDGGAHEDGGGWGGYDGGWGGHEDGGAYEDGGAGHDGGGGW